MSFPLFRRPQKIVFLDDDPHYLDMLAVVMPQRWQITLLVRPHDFVGQLQQDRSRWEADAWAQQQIVRRWRESGRSLIAQVLDYWCSSDDRFAITGVCVVDYSMPGMNGLQALEQVSGWPGRRVLLTGQADEQVAVGAFNDGLINQFIGKHAPEISKTLISSISSLLDSPQPVYEQIWRATLQSEQVSLLQSRSCAGDLARMIQDRYVEHILIGDPFGVIGLSADGDVGWIQLETREGLHAAAELAQLKGLNEQAIAAIRQGSVLSDLELRQSPGLQGVPASVQPAVPIGDDDQLLAAHFKIDQHSLAASLTGYRRWLAGQKERQVQD